MRKILHPVLARCRIRQGHYASADSDGCNGAFRAICPETNGLLVIIASDGKGWADGGMAPPAWEHVSVSLANRTPNWREMCFVKQLFWTDDECVLQFHPPADRYVNHHPHCLHMWRPIGVDFPMPPIEAVGPVSAIQPIERKEDSHV